LTWALIKKINITTRNMFVFVPRISQGMQYYQNNFNTHQLGTSWTNEHIV